MTDVTPSPPAFDAGVLLAHRGFLHALARRLVDEHTAEDVVQETYAKALERLPGSLLSPRAWLAQVVQNFARKTAGRERTRRQREHRAGGPDRIEDEGERASQEVELLHHVSTALRALPQPYKTTVYLRYYEDLGPREIAKRQGVPVDTVKSRLRRGLSLLRSDLDDRYGGDRRSWCLLLATQLDAVPTATTTAGIAAKTVLPGVLTVKAASLVFAAVAFAAVVFFALQSSEPEPAVLTAANTPLENGMTSPGEDLVAQDLPDVERTELTRSPTAPPVLVAPAERRRIVLSVVDGLGTPVEGARVGFLPALESSTGVDGSTAIELSTSEGFRGRQVLGIQAEGFLPFRRDVQVAADTTDLGTFSLIRGGRILGRVEEPSGAGMADVVVTASAPGELLSPGFSESILRSQGIQQPTGTTDGFGDFVLESVHPGSVRVWAGVGGAMDGASGLLTVAAGEEIEGVVIRLEPIPGDDEISGIVLVPDGVTGAALRVWSRHQGPEGRVTQTAPVAENGLFRISLQRSVPHDLWVGEDLQTWDERRHVWTGERILEGFRGNIAEGVPPGTRDLVLTFEEAPSFEVQVFGPEGEVISPFDLGVIEFDGEDLRIEIPWFRQAETGARVSVPSVGFHVVVSADGHDRASFGPFYPGTAPDPLRVDLMNLPRVSGRVVAQGAPVSNAHVEFFRPAQRNEKIVSKGFLLRMNAVAAADGHTDASGDFALTLRRSGDYYIRASAPGWAAAEAGPIPIDHRVGAEDLEVQLSRGGAIEGRVLLPPGMSAEGWIVGASRGDPHGQTLVTGADGAFRFDTLAPGEWIVERLSSPDGITTIGYGRPAPWNGNTEVREGETTRFDMDFRAGGFSVVQGRLTLEGGSSPGMTASLRRGGLESLFDGESADTVRVGADGTFSLAVPVAGRYTLVLRGGEIQEGGLILGKVFDLEGGTFTWESRIQLGTLEGRVNTQGLAPGARLVHVSRDSNGILALVPLPMEGDGSLRTVPVPSGRANIRVLTMPPAPDPETWPLFAEVEVRAGETLRLERDG